MSWREGIEVTTIIVKNNNVDFGLRRLKTEVAKSGTLSAYRDKLEYKKPGVRLREEKKQNIITDRRVIKLKQSDKKKTFKEFKDLTKYKNQQENISRTYNSGGLGFLNSKLFGNVFLRKKVLES